MSTITERRITITSGALELEAAIHDGDGALAALVLHPHPQYGGDMHNHVVTAICGSIAARGGSTLRLNFRGVGRSQGAYGNGPGEADDARAALDSLRTLVPGAKVVLAGYSFGAMIAASVASEANLSALVLVSPAVSMAPLPDLDAGLPMLLIAGERDQVAPADAVRALATGSRKAVIIEGVDHSWWPGVESLVTEIGAFLDGVIVGTPDR